MTAHRPAPRPLIRAVLEGASYIKRRMPPPRIVPSKRIESALATPTWSVRSLLPPAEGKAAADISTAEEITRDKLHHLLNLSALPLPKTPAEEQSLLDTLRAQIHFVREIQKVDTSGVEPLRAIRDETAEHIEETTVTLDDLREVFEQEEVVGRNGRIRRKVNRDADGNEVPVVDEESMKAQQWNCFEMGEVVKGGEDGVGAVDGEPPEMVAGEVPRRRSGRYFVVRRNGKTRAEDMG
jgi:Asp-tRNA(Asn)/Glu-tRNA(Gln) amidotransferase C subunit